MRTRMPRTIFSGRGTPVAPVWRSLPPSSSPDRSGGESIPVFSPGSWQEGIPFVHGWEDVKIGPNKKNIGRESPEQFGSRIIEDPGL